MKENKSMATIRVSGIQMFVSLKLDENLEKILHHIEASDCDFIVFPEMSLTGYHADASDRVLRSAWKKIATACRQSYATAIIGTAAKIEGATYIQSRIYGADGGLVGTHEKLVPTLGDREFCRPGEELRVFKDRGVTLGCLICNDMWVTPGCGPYPDPRLAYQLGKKGAQVIFHTIHSGTSAVHAPYHESNLVLRAMESKLFIATANAADARKAINAPTGIVTPAGKWLARCPAIGEQKFVQDIEIDSE
jgi:predicted amidohydrolase